MFLFIVDLVYLYPVYLEKYFAMGNWYQNAAAEIHHNFSICNQKERIEDEIFGPQKGVIF